MPEAGLGEETGSSISFVEFKLVDVSEAVSGDELVDDCAG
jgi:hypothetical protein